MEERKDLLAILPAPVKKAEAVIVALREARAEVVAAHQTEGDIPQKENKIQNKPVSFLSAEMSYSEAGVDVSSYNELLLVDL